MPPMASHPPPFSTLILTLLGTLAGYYLGKASGLKTTRRIKDLKSSPPVSPDDPFTPASPTTTTTAKSAKSPPDEDDDDEDDDWATTSSTIDPYTNLSEDCKMVFVVRTDLSMTKGKMAAQCGHATLMCYKSVQKHAPSILERWEKFGQAKIALKCSGGEGEGGMDGEEELETLAGVAASLGVVARIVRDAGRTQIKAGSATVLGVGPAPRSVVDQITGHLKLL
ncbi:peptidyl-tRNA hydrolase II [Choiromyces venosus 120613-1]|uniref:peptidyl-tRNA hydrolase n=1 Tax=Choiromyces venosus 120613-1 TaxID=1336337 RepID=A0A3N4JVY5_9PEZI|nr:peptidyl-tRNA hydrolase II [Choiromyces venosus 120613-1]